MMQNDQKKANQEAFRAIYEACEEGIIAVDEEGEIKMANTAAHTIFGYDENELPGHSIEDLVPPKLKQQHQADRVHYNKNPHPRRMGAGRDLLATKKNGEYFPVEISLNTAYFDNKRHVIAYVIDISERKKMEHALKKSEEQLILYAAQLEKRVKERTEELEHTNQALKRQIQETKKAEKEAISALERERELNELKSRFVSTASHEFRTPLSTILSSASLIERYSQAEAQEKRLKHIQKIKSSIGNLNTILEDFLSVSKLEEGKVDVQIDTVDLTALCAEVIDELSSIKKANQSLIFSSEGTPELIAADPKIIKNIVINLTSNAIKYSEKDITIRVDYRANDHLCLSIIDEGIGIPQEEQKHLFDRFFRARNATHIQGTGLGLNIVKKYVDMLSGTIEFKSEANEGTEFYVRLPKVTK
uniref:histidine kinase n=1 Tax=Roseihalotalea indica TaxID=2867963 RepID=A0AA49JIE3_9BACT|nr:PAS domain-containing sensor histidine kinase [Tunicatimonas sp. TK19036]